MSAFEDAEAILADLAVDAGNLADALYTQQVPLSAEWSEKVQRLRMTCSEILERLDAYEAKGLTPEEEAAEYARDRELE